MEKIEVMVTRVDIGDVSCIPLKQREYRWKIDGKPHNIKGVYNLMKTSEINVEFSNGIEKDLREYEKIVAKRKKSVSE